MEQDLFFHLGDVVDDTIADHLSFLGRVGHVIGTGCGFYHTAGQGKRRLVEEHPLLVEKLPTKNGVKGRIPFDQPGQEVAPIAAGSGNGMGTQIV